MYEMCLMCKNTDLLCFPNALATRSNSIAVSNRLISAIAVITSSTFYRIYHKRARRIILPPVLSFQACSRNSPRSKDTDTRNRESESGERRGGLSPLNSGVNPAFTNGPGNTIMRPESYRLRARKQPRVHGSRQGLLAMSDAIGISRNGL